MVFYGDFGVFGHSLMFDTTAIRNPTTPTTLHFHHFGGKKINSKCPANLIVAIVPVCVTPVRELLTR